MRNNGMSRFSEANPSKRERSEQTRQHRLAWKQLFKEITDRPSSLQTNLSVDEIVRVANQNLAKMHSEEKVKASDIYQYRSFPVDLNNVKSLRVPKRQSVAWAIALALKELGAWKSEEYQSREGEELQAFMTFLGYESDPLYETYYERVSRGNLEKFLKHDNLIFMSSFDESSPHRIPWVLEDTKARGQLIEHILSDRNLLVITYPQQESRQPSLENFSSLSVVPIIRKMLYMVADAIINNPERAEEIFRAASRRLRFALIEPPSDPRLFDREFAGRIPTMLGTDRFLSSRPDHSIDNTRILETLLPMNAELLVVEKGLGDQGQWEPLIGLGGGDWTPRALKWVRAFSEQGMNFYRLSEDITTAEEFLARLGGLGADPLLVKISA